MPLDWIDLKGVLHIRRNVCSMPQMKGHVRDVFKTYQTQNEFSLSQICTQAWNAFKPCQNCKYVFSLYWIHNHARNVFRSYQNCKKVFSLYQICNLAINVFKSCQINKNAFSLYRIHNHAFHICYSCLDHCKRKRDK